jgi:hypothetical protein
MTSSYPEQAKTRHRSREQDWGWRHRMQLWRRGGCAKVGHGSLAHDDASLFDNEIPAAGDALRAVEAGWKVGYGGSRLARLQDYWQRSPLVTGRTGLPRLGVISRHHYANRTITPCCMRACLWRFLLLSEASPKLWGEAESRKVLGTPQLHLGLPPR